MTNLLDHYLKVYEGFIILGHINEQDGCKNRVKSKTCFKSAERSSIDKILRSTPSLHQFTNLLENDLIDHHLTIYTMLKSTYTKSEPKILRKRKYTNFRKEPFRRDLKQVLKNDDNFSNFNDDFTNALDIYKNNQASGNVKSHINKLWKEIMKRTIFKNNKIGEI